MIDPFFVLPTPRIMRTRGFALAMGFISGSDTKFKYLERAGGDQGVRWAGFERDARLRIGTIIDGGSTMRLSLGFTLLLFMTLAPSAGAFAGDSSQAPAMGQFPPLTASNLAGQTLSLPADFGGKRNLLLIAFERRQQQNVDTWLHQMKRYENVSGFHYFELPTIERMNPVTRWFIDNGMRRGIPDPGQRARTVTLYLDKDPFCQSLRITDQKQIYALLVDPSGTVLWRAEGDFDEAKGASLTEALKRGAQ